MWTEGVKGKIRRMCASNLCPTWKCSKITPIPKKNNISDMIMKCLEEIVLCTLLVYFTLFKDLLFCP